MLVEFWNLPGNARYSSLSTEIQDWLDKDRNVSDNRSSKKHARVIRANSPNLDFAGTILDTMTDLSTGQLIIVTDFPESIKPNYNVRFFVPHSLHALLYHSVPASPLPSIILSLEPRRSFHFADLMAVRHQL